MAVRASRSATDATEALDVVELLAGYEAGLSRQPLSARSRLAYLAQARGYLGWLATSEHGPEALTDRAVRDWAVRDYKRYVKTTRQWSPASVNQALAAIDNFYRHVGIGRPDVVREELAQVAPRALEVAEQRAFLRAVEASPSARNRAIANVFFYAGLRLKELTDLNLADVAVTARIGRVTVRSGKGEAYREVPLNSACRKALDEWFEARSSQLVAHAESERTVEADTAALWLSRSGRRMGARAVDFVIRGLAADSKLELSAHVLRHTCVTNLIRSGADVVLVAEIAGHKRLDTTRRYSLPSQADKDAALEKVLVEI